MKFKYLYFIGFHNTFLLHISTYILTSDDSFNILITDSKPPSTPSNTFRKILTICRLFKRLARDLGMSEEFQLFWKLLTSISFFCILDFCPGKVEVFAQFLIFLLAPTTWKLNKLTRRYNVSQVHSGDCQAAPWK